MLNVLNNTQMYATSTLTDQFALFVINPRQHTPHNK